MGRIASMTPSEVGGNDAPVCYDPAPTRGRSLQPRRRSTDLSTTTSQQLPERTASVDSTSSTESVPEGFDEDAKPADWSIEHVEFYLYRRFSNDQIDDILEMGSVALYGILHKDSDVQSYPMINELCKIYCPQASWIPIKQAKEAYFKERIQAMRYARDMAMSQPPTLLPKTRGRAMREVVTPKASRQRQASLGRSPPTPSRTLGSQTNETAQDLFITPLSYVTTPSRSPEVILVPETPLPTQQAPQSAMGLEPKIRHQELTINVPITHRMQDVEMTSTEPEKANRSVQLNRNISKT